MSSTIIGIPTEIKTDERRVSLTPNAVGEITSNGNQVVVQSGAGGGAGFDNYQYEKAGAKIVETAEEVFKESKIIVKVKEPQEDERKLLTPEHTLFTYLHLAADKKQTEDLISSNSTCIAFETVTDDQGSLPLLTPMSAIAGRMSIQAGAHCLEARQGGNGVLLAGAPGAGPGRVVVLGCGVVGSNAVEIAVGMGAEVIVLDRDQKILDSIEAYNKQDCDSTQKLRDFLLNLPEYKELKFATQKVKSDINDNDGEVIDNQDLIGTTTKQQGEFLHPNYNSFKKQW